MKGVVTEDVFRFHTPDEVALFAELVVEVLLEC